MEEGTLKKTRPATPVKWQHPNNHLPHTRQQRRRSDESGFCCARMICRARFVAILAVLLGVAVMGTCGWVLHKAIQDWRNPTLKTASVLLSQVNTFFGGTTGLYDLDVIYTILTSCSATGFVGGVLQFLLSMWLFLALVKDGRAVSRVWVMAHIVIMLAVGGAFLCIITNELEINDAITALLIVTGIDFILLIPFSLLFFMYSTQEDNGDTYV
ncbi:hypothetical protein Ocin01_11086 [Orchesella cincta]|uniref:Transmembrane protein n=1 Tax=Orchesella cincta TaxID=48709 RepID=A0A1D2MRC5_ORCCI|nr:hypothetical protein Ocin01_11086 [Orchesella cincta]